MHATEPPRPLPTKANGKGVLAVVVVYERNLKQVEAWPMLKVELALDAGQARPARLRLQHVLIYDNSKQPRARPPEGQVQCSYVHDPGNGGTAAAYVCAAKLAHDLGLDWVLLLDHDTLLPERYLACATAALAQATVQPAALLPWVCHGERVVSPARVTWAGSIRPLCRGRAIYPSALLTGIASGAMVRTASMTLLIDLPPALWLDYVDHWLFVQLQRNGSRISIIEAQVNHDLSIADMGALRRDRMDSILKGELQFVRALPLLARLCHPVRLLARALRTFPINPTLAYAMVLRLGQSLMGISGLGR